VLHRARAARCRPKRHRLKPALTADVPPQPVPEGGRLRPPGVPEDRVPGGRATKWAPLHRAESAPGLCARAGGHARPGSVSKGRPRSAKGPRRPLASASSRTALRPNEIFGIIGRITTQSALVLDPRAPSRTRQGRQRRPRRSTARSVDIFKKNKFSVFVNSAGVWGPERVAGFLGR
jgi:hypothetical protein